MKERVEFRYRLLGILLGIAAAALGLFMSSRAHAASYPTPWGFVTDVSNLLPQQTREGLEKKLTEYRDKTSIEIAVLIIPTLDGNDAHDYADGVWKQWGIGKKGQDNGVLLLVVPPPEKIAWIQTGYGIQGWLTDVGCKHIVDDVMKPLNIQDKRPEAVVAGVVAIMSKLGDTPWATRATMTPPKDDGGGTMAIIFIVFLVLIVAFFFFVATNGGFGGGGGYYGSSSSGGGWSSGGGDSGGSSFGGGSSGGGGGGGGSG